MTPLTFLRWWIATCLALNAGLAHADSWSFKSSEREFAFSQGIRFVMTTDASKSTQSPEFHLKIYQDQTLMAHYPGIEFEHLVESPNGELFVGLSNYGIPGSAAAVFTRNGGLRVLVFHGLAKFKYCEKSVTMRRLWYDQENPNIRFDGPSKSGGITIRNCRGKQVPLFAGLSRLAMP